MYYERRNEKRILEVMRDYFHKFQFHQRKNYKWVGISAESLTVCSYFMGKSQDMNGILYTVKDPIATMSTQGQEGLESSLSAEGVPTRKHYLKFSTTAKPIHHIYW